MTEKAVGSYDKRSDKIGFHEWNLPTIEKHMEAYRELLSEALEEGMAIATEEYKCNAWFPIVYGRTDGQGGPCVDDPDVVYVELPLGEGMDNNPRWKFALSELIEHFVEMYECGDGGSIESDDRHILVSMRDHMRRLAEVLDEALTRPIENK